MHFKAHTTISASVLSVRSLWDERPVVRWFTGGREPRGTDNEPSGNRSLEPHAWLTDVLTRLPEWPEERLAELLPLEGFTFFG